MQTEQFCVICLQPPMLQSKAWFECFALSIYFVIINLFLSLIYSIYKMFWNEGYTFFCLIHRLDIYSRPKTYVKSLLYIGHFNIQWPYSIQIFTPALVKHELEMKEEDILMHLSFQRGTA
jgi:hypothetical protein